MYDQLAKYYKYSDPQKHIKFYMKHYEEVQKFIAIYQQRHSQSVPVSMQPAQIRILHASPNTPAADIYVNGQRIVQNITFKQHSNYISLPQGQYRIDVYPTSTQSAPLFSAIVPAMGGYIYTIAAAGDIAKLQLLSFVDSTYLPYGKAKLRFIHLSPDAPAVDLVMKDSDILFANVPFKQATEFLEVSSGSAELEVHVTGMKNVILSLPDDVKVEANKIYNIYAIGFTNKEPKLEALFLTN
jgi:hypothetical protein